MTNTGSLQEGQCARPPTAKPSRYRSPLRQAQATATRAAVLEAASELFRRDGFPRTTMAAIAETSAVSVETVYAQGSKAEILLACVERALTGDDEPVALLQRPAFVRALAETDQVEVVEAYVRALTEVSDRASALIVAFEDAAAADAATALLWRHAEQQRRADVQRLVEAVAALGPLRPGLDVVSATDGLWVSLTPRYAHQLASLGWSLERRSAWTARSVLSLLLPTTPRSTT